MTVTALDTVSTVFSSSASRSEKRTSALHLLVVAAALIAALVSVMIVVGLATASPALLIASGLIATVSSIAGVYSGMALAS